MHLTKGIVDSDWTRWEIASAEVAAGSEDADADEDEVVVVGGMTTIAEGGLEMLAGAVEGEVVAAYVNLTLSIFLYTHSSLASPSSFFTVASTPTVTIRKLK